MNDAIGGFETIDQPQVILYLAMTRYNSPNSIYLSTRALRHHNGKDLPTTEY
jgi:hypothetical protein